MLEIIGVVDGSDTEAWAIALSIALTVGIIVRYWFYKKLDEGVLN